MKSHRILIVGAGELGMALGGYLKGRGHEISFWDVDPTRVSGKQPLHELVSFVDFVFLCVPSWAIRGVLSDIVSKLPLRTVIVSFAKGIDPTSRETTGELLPELLSRNQPFVVVGGPMLAAEIAIGKGSAAVFASLDKDIAQTVSDLFVSEVFTTELSTDIAGVSLAGVLKNIYAIALGIADGLDLGDNEKGWLVVRALKESVSIAKILGVDSAMILGTAGLADFIATGYSVYSRNRTVGDEIVKKGQCNLKGEGTASLPPLLMRLNGKIDQFPLLSLVKAIAIDCKPAESAMEEYFTGKKVI